MKYVEGKARGEGARRIGAMACVVLGRAIEGERQGSICAVRYGGCDLCDAPSRLFHSLRFGFPFSCHSCQCWYLFVSTLDSIIISSFFLFRDRDCQCGLPYLLIALRVTFIPLVSCTAECLLGFSSIHPSIRRSPSLPSIHLIYVPMAPV